MRVRCTPDCFGATLLRSGLNKTLEHMTPEAEFEHLRMAAIAADDASFGDCRALEPSLVGIITLVKAHPELRREFVCQFVRMATGELSSPPELVPFCMRELRYPEVIEAVRTHLDELHKINKHARYMNYCSHVVRAYEDFVWEDAGMWQYYRAKELTPEIVPLLIDRLSSSDAEVQFNALLALEDMGSVASSALPAVQHLLRTQPASSNVGRRAALVVKAIQSSNQPLNVIAPKDGAPH